MKSLDWNFHLEIKFFLSSILISAHGKNCVSLQGSEISQLTKNVSHSFFSTTENSLKLEIWMNDKAEIVENT